ncbi:MAG: metallophosphoesterase family protein [Verrucomicrobiae bacterium]|nr:metallophosphoesterase family protein [Verrucomicrobiae bacterium]
MHVATTAALTQPSAMPLLVFGGPYGNLEATRAVLEEASRRRISPDRILCTGDLVAYCASPVETVRLVRDAGIRVIRGNCDEQLAAGADDCGCGYPPDGMCDRLSRSWYEFASSRLGEDERAYLGSLPETCVVTVGDARLLAVHGTMSTINEFVFEGTPDSRKQSDLAETACDGIIGGHSGIPFSQVLDGKLWHNAGVVGMPANDGTPRVWYSVLSPMTDGSIEIEHCPLIYDYMAAQAAMAKVGIVPEYREALATGLWPSLDVLPEKTVREPACRSTGPSSGGVLQARRQHTGPEFDGRQTADHERLGSITSTRQRFFNHQHSLIAVRRQTSCALFVGCLLVHKCWRRVLRVVCLHIGVVPVLTVGVASGSALAERRNQWSTPPIWRGAHFGIHG